MPSGENNQDRFGVAEGTLRPQTGCQLNKSGLLFDTPMRVEKAGRRRQLPIAGIDVQVCWVICLTVERIAVSKELAMGRREFLNRLTHYRTTLPHFRWACRHLPQHRNKSR
jgi:hypothetical protein